MPAIIPEKAAIRAKTAIPLAGETAAAGSSLLLPPKKLDNPLILAENGIITSISSASHKYPAGYKMLDYGDVCLMPPTVNAHTHLQLSWLKNRLKFHAGFTEWLESLVPHIIAANKNINILSAHLQNPVAEAMRELAQSGTKFIGDVGGSLPGAITAIIAKASEYGLNISCLCEWFGFSENPGPMPWPERCRDELKQNEALQKRCSPAGHALYSTDLRILQTAKQWCAKTGRIFSFHLAESEDENALLYDGTGALADYYRGKVLPPSWQPYGMRPFALARKHGLLDSKTLIVHGVTLNKAEARLFAQSGAALCLCPRSNALLNVGLPPFAQYLEAGAMLCLGTDGLTSNTDLDVRNEAIFLRKNLDAPKEALLRMLTVNGAHALGLPVTSCQLLPGGSAAFSILPEELV